MAKQTTLKVDTDGYLEVVKYCLDHGMKIGKFYEIAAKEKLNELENQCVVLERYALRNGKVIEHKG